MSEIQIRQMPNFKKAYKKLPEAHRLLVNGAIRSIVNNPEIGKEKKGDLSGIYVYKKHLWAGFRFHKQLK